MYLIEPRTTDIVVKQFFYKFKANSSVFYGLIAIQLLALLASSGGINSSGTNRGSLIINIHEYSADIVIPFTIIWMFICAIRLSVSHREIDFSFVSNRFCSNISNIGFLTAISCISGVTASLCAVIIRVIIYFVVGAENILVDNFYIAPKYLLLGMASSILYIILFCSIGYLYGIFIRISRLFVFFVPACIIGELIITKIFNIAQNEYFFLKIMNFYFLENSFLSFFVKVTVTSAALLVSSVILSERLEVRR